MSVGCERAENSFDPFRRGQMTERSDQSGRGGNLFVTGASGDQEVSSPDERGINETDLTVDDATNDDDTGADVSGFSYDQIEGLTINDDDSAQCSKDSSGGGRASNSYLFAYVPYQQYLDQQLPSHQFDDQFVDVDFGQLNNVNGLGIHVQNVGGGDDDYTLNLLPGYAAYIDSPPISDQLQDYEEPNVQHSPQPVISTSWQDTRNHKTNNIYGHSNVQTYSPNNNLEQIEIDELLNPESPVQNDSLLQQLNEHEPNYIEGEHKPFDQHLQQHFDPKISLFVEGAEDLPEDQINRLIQESGAYNILRKLDRNNYNP